jgi:hypothetical protein
MENYKLIKLYNNFGFTTDVIGNICVIKYLDIIIGEMNLDECRVSDIIEYYEFYSDVLKNPPL